MKSDIRLQYFRPIQDKIGYAFKNIKLLQQALTHRSYSAQNNERFEFIGDSILDYVVAKMLYDAFPNLPEGRLSPLRAQLVKEATLAEIARALGLGNAKDAKTRLQEWLQGKRFALPKYRIEKQTGEGNDARFDVSCDLGELGQIFYAQAHSRRAAEQECAQQALAWLEEKFAKKK